MKFGIICEGAPNGEDRRVYEFLINQLLPANSVSEKPRGFPLGRKPDLIEQCGDGAKALLELDGCDHVVILWDLQPAWGGKASCKKDCEDIRASLRKAGLNIKQLQQIHLVCIEHELETWLLMDEGAILARLKQIKQKRGKGYEVSINHPERELNPKKKLEKIFSNNGYREYEAAIDAEKIIQLVDLRRLRRCQSFLRFESIVLGNHTVTYLLE